jgi:hypothetical protein
MPNPNKPSWPARFVDVRAAFAEATTPFTATRYPKAESTDIARSATPAVVLALRTERLVSASPLTSPTRRASTGREPRSSLGTDFVQVPRDAVVQPVGRWGVAVFMISPMVGGLRCKLIVYLRRKEVKDIDREDSRWFRRPSRPQSSESL